MSSRGHFYHVLAAVVAALPLHVFALDKEQIGEHCYNVTHEPEKYSTEELRACHEKIYSQPILVITPTRVARDIHTTPAPVSVVTEKDKKRASNESVAELVRDVPGVEVSDSGQPGLKRIRIRGEESRRVAVMIDGQEFQDEREVGTPLLIAPEMIERIEVVRGPGSVINGSRAIGGTINIITKKGGYHPVQGSATLTYDSSANGFQPGASIYGSKDEFAYRVSVAGADYGDRRSGDGKVDNTSFDNRSVAAYVGKRIDEHTIGLSYDNFQSDSDVYVEERVKTTPPFLDFRIDSPQRDRAKGALFYDFEQKGATLSKGHLDGYYQRSDREFNTFSDTAVPGLGVSSTSVFNDSSLGTFGGNGQLDFALPGSHYLITGFKWKNDELDQSRARQVKIGAVPPPPAQEVIDNASQYAIEGFIYDEWEFVESWKLGAGVRGYAIGTDLENTTRPNTSTSSSDDTHGVGSLSLTYLGVPNTTFWGGVSQGYVHPTMVELGTGAFAGPNFVHPNPNLQPETAVSFDLGVRYDDGTLAIDTAAFYVDSQDYIGRVLCSERSGICPELVGARDQLYVNIEEATSFGVEATTSYTMAPFTPYITTTFIRREYERKDSSTYDTGLPTVYGRAGLRFEQPVVPTVSAWVDAYSRAASEADELDTNNELIHRPGWTTWNVAFGVDFGRMKETTVAVDFVNLGDREYINAPENIPAPGRSVIVRVAGRF